MRRIYLDPADCERDIHTIFIKGHTSHYLVNVLRLKEGEIFTGFDGRGNEYEISVKEIKKKLLKGEILKIEKTLETESPFNINLFQSIPKGSKMDRIISEIAQLGVKKIYPVISTRVVPQITEDNIIHKKRRWERIAIEASKVAGREKILEIELPVKFTEAVKIPGDVKLIFWEKATTSLKNVIRNIGGIKNGTTINVFIGPEGGYTDEEIETGEKNGAISVSMGKRVLKVETASVIAVALIMYEIENP